MCVSETLFFIVFSKCLFGPVLCTLSFPNNFSRPFSKKLAILNLFDAFFAEKQFSKKTIRPWLLRGGQLDGILIKLSSTGFYGEAFSRNSFRGGLYGERQVLENDIVLWTGPKRHVFFLIPACTGEI